MEVFVYLTVNGILLDTGVAVKFATGTPDDDVTVI